MDEKMIWFCESCRGHKEMDKKPSLCVACGANRFIAFKTKREYFENEIKVSPDGHLLSMMKCNNKLGDYTDLITKLEEVVK